MIWLNTIPSFAVENQEHELQIHVPKGWNHFRDANEPEVDKFIDDSGKYQCLIARARAEKPLSLNELMVFSRDVFNVIFPESPIVKQQVSIHDDEEGLWCFSYIASEESTHHLGIAVFSFCNRAIAIVWETDEENEELLVHSKTFLKNMKCITQ
jgi:hypothetical protein